MPDDSMRLLNAKPDEGSLELTEDKHDRIHRD